jgi:hypothetical protein
MQLSLDRTLFPVQDTVPCTGHCSHYRTQFRVQYSTLFPVLDTVSRRGNHFTDAVPCARFCSLSRTFFPIQDIVSVQDTVYCTGPRCLHKTLFLHWTLFPEEDPTCNTATVPCIGLCSLWKFIYFVQDTVPWTDTISCTGLYSLCMTPA